MPDSTFGRPALTTRVTLLGGSRTAPTGLCGFVTGQDCGRAGTLRCWCALMRVGAGRILWGISETTNGRGATIGPQDDSCYGGRPDRSGAAGRGFAGTRPCGYGPRLGVRAL